jgi:hypothetical protein
MVVADMARPGIVPFGDPSTRAGPLSTLSFHQAYHTGQPEKAAILAPGQTSPL